MRYHFVGIGGYSMSGLAQVLAAEGHIVTGSDVKRSSRTDRLQARGIPVRFGHRAENVAGAEVVVFSTDVPADNPELLAARERAVPVRHRSEILAEILARGEGIAVTGTHGKTTTTTMIGRILTEAGLDPTVLVGGEVPAFDGNLRLGRGPFVVAEADESDGSFLRYEPRITVATNVEPEHLEHYGNDFSRVVAAYREFLRRGPAGAVKILAGDDPVLTRLAEGLPGRVIRYGIGRGYDLWAEEPRREAGRQLTTVYFEGRGLGELDLALPGRHNLKNALAATAAALAAGADFGAVARTLRDFTNAHRRFEIRYRGAGITIVDDYAHHPTEIRAVLAAAREAGAGRLVAVFQPQRYTRTRNLWDDFRKAFREADLLILADIYSPPGERPLAGISSARLAEELERSDNQTVKHLPGEEEILAYLLETVRPGDLVLTMGAGDIWRVAERLGELLAGRVDVADRQVL